MVPTILCLGLFEDAVLGVADYVKSHDPAVQIRAVKYSQARHLSGDTKGVVAHLTGQGHLDELRNAGDFPIVNTSGVRESLQVTTTRFDDHEIGRLAAEHLRGRGHRRFACVTRTWEDYAHRRHTAFAEVIQSVELDCHVFERDAVLTEPPVHRDFARWLAELPKPVGVFGVTDDIAAECIFTAEELGIPIPQDVAILGAGDTTRLVEVVRPTISSVRTPWRLLGYRAAEQLYRMIGGDAPPVQADPILVQPESVVTRQSSDTFAVEDELVRSALRYIAEHIHEQINVTDLLRALPVSRRVLEVRFREHLGRTPLKEIHRQRIERAKQLLIRTDLTVETVAVQAGFTNKVRFTDIFKRQIGLPPAEFRSQYQLRPSN
ncbi:MAG: substrate-binding domain-containing protein [Phycisphaerae bacterium]